MLTTTSMSRHIDLDHTLASTTAAQALMISCIAPSPGPFIPKCQVGILPESACSTFSKPDLPMPTGGYSIPCRYSPRTTSGAPIFRFATIKVPWKLADHKIGETAPWAVVDEKIMRGHQVEGTPVGASTPGVLV